jgi:hypothetical protein
METQEVVNKNDPFAFIYAVSGKPTLEEMLEKQRQGFRMMKWELRLMWLIQTRQKLYQTAQRCRYCGKELTFDESTLDHVHPSSRGCEDEETNCVICCDLCNKHKGNMLLADWKKTPYYRWIRGIGPQPQPVANGNPKRQYNFLNFQILYFLRSPLC